MILHYYFFQVQRKLWTMLEAKKTPFVQQDMAHRPVVPEGAGGAIDPQILADQLTLSQPGGADYAHHITTGTPGFSDLPTALAHAISSQAVWVFLRYVFIFELFSTPLQYGFYFSERDTLQ